MKAWKLQISLILVGLSLVLFLVHVALFHDVGTLGFYLALDVVFVPIQVLLVSILIERLLSAREHEAVLHKLNMVIGAFFGEVGSELVRQLLQLCRDPQELCSQLGLTNQWTREQYRAATSFVEAHKCEFRRDRPDLAQLKGFLLGKRAFVLGLLQNPSLLEHNEFTDMIWAVCHLTEELEARADFESLPDSDVDHLLGDVRRAFTALVRQWLAYMNHLQSAYPYMHSLAVRTNPFRRDASPLVH